MSSILQDRHGRKASYLRVSVTDRCNLRCTYCAGAGDFIPHPDILRYEEIITFMDMARNMGIEKVRFTGGEPFVRKGFADFLVEAATRFPEMELCVTTNGTMLVNDVERLAAAGIRRLNISLDTLDKEKYARITGRDLFDRTRSCIDRCLDAGMTVKVNAVAMKGINDDELPAFVEFARNNPVDMRFIEFMPVGLENGWRDSAVWRAADILADAEKVAVLHPVDTDECPQHGPARMFTIDGGKGRLGLISPIPIIFAIPATGCVSPPTATCAPVFFPTRFTGCVRPCVMKSSASRPWRRSSAVPAATSPSGTSC